MRKRLITPRRTVLDGVPTYYAAIDGPFTATLAFRVGRADETLLRSGLTHLIEHLAMPIDDAHALEANATVEPSLTVFYATGPRETVLAASGREPCGWRCRAERGSRRLSRPRSRISRFRAWTKTAAPTTSRSSVSPSGARSSRSRPGSDTGVFRRQLRYESGLSEVLPRKLDELAALLRAQ